MDKSLTILADKMGPNSIIKLIIKFMIFPKSCTKTEFQYPCCKRVPTILWYLENGHLFPDWGNCCGLFTPTLVVIMSDELVWPKSVLNSLCNLAAEHKWPKATKK